jgi:hypothetical protein
VRNLENELAMMRNSSSPSKRMTVSEAQAVLDEQVRASRWPLSSITSDHIAELERTGCAVSCSHVFDIHDSTENRQYQTQSCLDQANARKTPVGALNGRESRVGRQTGNVRRRRAHRARVSMVPDDSVAARGTARCSRSHEYGGQPRAQDHVRSRQRAYDQTSTRFRRGW